MPAINMSHTYTGLHAVSQNLILILSDDMCQKLILILPDDMCQNMHD